MDYGHEQTDKMLKKLEKKIKKEYSQASKEVEKSMLDYLKRFEENDNEMLSKLHADEITIKEYTEWRTKQMIITDKWEKQRDQLAETYMNADRVASELIKGTTYETYAINHNYGTFEAENGAKVDTSYTLYSKDTVSRLVKDDPQLLPKIGKTTSEKIRRGELKKWNEKQIQSVMMQGVLQGESIPKIAKRLATTVGEKNSYSHIRAARTMTTSAENAGRIDSYKRAEAMGIKMKKQWLATQDNRTRHSHVLLDGESVPINEKFSNGLMFPADPDGAPAEVYNCRCTLIGDIADVSDELDDQLNPELANMGYEEWTETHEMAQLEDIISGTGNVTIEEASEDWFEYENANMMAEYIRTGKMPKENMYGQLVSDDDRERLIYDANLIQEVGAKTNTKQNTLYRGMVMNEDEVRALTPNDTYTMRTLTATTPDRKLANVYMDVENSGIEGGVPVIFEIQKPDGIFGFKRDDLETVLPKGSSFKVVRNYMDEDGVVHVSLYAKKGKNNVILDAEAGVKKLTSKLPEHPVVTSQIKGVSKNKAARSEWIKSTLGVSKAEADELLDVIGSYTSESDFYSKVHNGDKSVLKEIKVLDKMMKNPNMPIYGDTIFRGIHVDDSDELSAIEKIQLILETGTWKEAGITSFSSQRQKANQFAEGGAYGDRTKGLNVLIINKGNKTGVPIQHLSGQRPEGEVLVPSDIADRGYKVLKYKFKDKHEEWMGKTFDSKWCIIEVEENL